MCKEYKNEGPRSSGLPISMGSLNQLSENFKRVTRMHRIECTTKRKTFGLTATSPNCLWPFRGTRLSTLFSTFHVSQVVSKTNDSHPFLRDTVELRYLYIIPFWSDTATAERRLT